MTREQKEKLVLDLLDQNKNTREIAKQVNMSFRDIGAIKVNAGKEKDAEKQHVEQEFLSSKAYELFSRGKSLVEVAIKLKIREPEATNFYVEYLKMTQLYDLSRVREEIGGDIGSIVHLYRSTKDAGMDIRHVLRLLKVANNDLPAVEYRYQNVKEHVNSLEEHRRDLNKQVTTITNNVEVYQAASRQEERKLEGLRQKRIELQVIARHFENNNEAYLKIRRIVEEKVYSILLDAKVLINLALFSITESMRSDPDKYGSLIYYNTNSFATTEHSSQYYAVPYYMYGQYQLYPPRNYYKEDYDAMLVQEAEKLYNKTAKELIDRIITGIATNGSS